MNANSRVFLDTSIQIERLIGPSTRKVAIEQRLAMPDFAAVTSQYVFMEFQRAVIADYVRVYNQVLRHETWDAIAYGIRSGKISQRPRSLSRCLQILTEIMVQSQLDRHDALDLLQYTIRRSLRKRFWNNVAPLPDAIVCDLVGIGVTVQADTSYTVADSCRKQNAACHLPDFFTDRRTEVKTLIDHLTVHPHTIKDQVRLVRLLEDVYRDPRAALGQNACWPLGDVIITLQVPPDALLWTRDSDFTTSRYAGSIKR